MMDDDNIIIWYFQTVNNIAEVRTPSPFICCRHGVIFSLHFSILMTNKNLERKSLCAVHVPAAKSLGMSLANSESHEREGAACRAQGIMMAVCGALTNGIGYTKPDRVV